MDLSCQIGPISVPPEAIAQARYALYEKHIRVTQSLELAREVFPEDSDNVVFWVAEERRVAQAISWFGD